MRLLVPYLMFCALIFTGVAACADAPAQTPPPAAASTQTSAPAATPVPAAAPAPAPANLSPTATSPAETALGKKTCELIEKECKLVKDEKAVARLNTIANNIAPYTQRPDVVYQCKILNTPGINAESIPGGYIYVTKGLLDAVESDDELAGVLAHEIGHNSLRHVKLMAEREKKASISQIAAICLSAIAARNFAEPAQIAVMSEYVKTAVMNGYSLEIEEQADKNGLLYLSKQKNYDPSGILSVMLGFRQMESLHPKMNLGCFQDHPDSSERVNYLLEEMKELGIKPDLWRVVKFRAEMAPVEDGKKGYMVLLGSSEVITYTVSDGKLDARARALAAVDAINNSLTKAFVQPYDVLLDSDGNTAVISMPTDPVLTITKADAEATTRSLEYLANRAKIVIRNAITQEITKRGW